MITMLVSILPIALYLLVLKLMDSFALARWKMLLLCMLYGIICCLAAFLLTNGSFLGLDIQVGGLSLMPLVEELLKGAILIWYIFRRKIRFMAESLIYGAAVGGGFSLLENSLYFYYNPDMFLGTAIVRGFGCAILHIGCTALFSTLLLLIISEGRASIKVLLAFIAPVAIHFAYNILQSGGYVSPMVMLAGVIVLFLVLFIVLFNWGEKKIYKWMDHSISIDIQTRSAIRNGTFSTTKAGEYLLGVKEQFNPEVFFDMICYVQLFLELKIEKQSLMLLSQAGFDSDDMGVTQKLHKEKEIELADLAVRIGKTGMWVLAPLVQDVV